MHLPLSMLRAFGRSIFGRIVMLGAVAALLVTPAYAQTFDGSGSPVVDGAAGAVLALVITELLKPVTPAKFYPLVASVVGIAWVMAMNTPTSVAAIGPSIVQGLLAGLSASGVYSAAKHVVSSNTAAATETATK